MTKYAVLQKSYIGGRLVDEGEIVELPNLKYDPARDTNLSPLVEPKRGRRGAAGGDAGDAGEADTGDTPPAAEGDLA